MAENVTKAYRKANGLCPDCGKHPRGTVRQRCDECFERWRTGPDLERPPTAAATWQKKYREACEAAGICTRCHKRPKDTGQKCKHCKELDRRRKARSRLLSVSRGWCAHSGCLERTNGTWYCDRHRKKQCDYKKKRAKRAKEAANVLELSGHRRPKTHAGDTPVSEVPGGGQTAAPGRQTTAAPVEVRAKG